MPTEENKSTTSNSNNNNNTSSSSNKWSYKVTPIGDENGKAKVTTITNNNDEEQKPGKKKSFLKTLTDDTSNFVHDLQSNVSNSIEKTKSINVKFKFHAPELPDEDDFIKLRKKLSRFVSVASWCFDSSVDNFPIGSALGLGMTIFSCILISASMYQIRTVVLKYDTEGNVTQYIGFYIFAIIFFIAVHSAVFLHGISVGIIETERELCGKTDAGNCCLNSCCCCCKKKSNLGFCCKILEKFAQRGCQLIWAIIGTVLLLVMYIVGLVMFLVSTLTSSTSYGLKYSCGLFENLLAEYMRLSEDYIATAKMHLTSADNVIAGVLESYSKWNNLQEQYSNSAVGQLGQASGIAAGGGSGAQVASPPASATSYTNSYGRRLSTSSSFDPSVALANGQSMVQVLNASIYDTESQLKYYDEQSKIVIVYCKDVGSLYNAFFFILVASLVILLSELLMFAVHTKYFSAWNYELELMDQENERKKLENKLKKIESSMNSVDNAATNNNSDGGGDKKD